MANEPWLTAAQKLAKGKSCRWRCCGDGKGAMIGAKDNGWSLFCFRDEAHNRFVPYPEPSFAERLARMTRQEAADAAAQASPVPTLPQGSPNPSEWPLAARVWLYKAGLSNTDISDLGALWSEELRRVILPVKQDGQIVYWQGRNVDGDRRPKYINPSVQRPLFDNGVEGSTLVLTEDILSAVKIGLSGFCAWSLLGTKFNDGALRRIVDFAGAAGNRVVVWLDPDEAGRTAGRKLRRTLAAYGVDARSIQSERDPKLCSRDLIRSYLNV